MTAYPGGAVAITGSAMDNQEPQAWLRVLAPGGAAILAPEIFGGIPTSLVFHRSRGLLVTEIDGAAGFVDAAGNRGDQLDFGDDRISLSGAVLMPDGTVMVAGSQTDTFGTDFGLWRFEDRRIRNVFQDDIATAVAPFMVLGGNADGALAIYGIASSRPEQALMLARLDGHRPIWTQPLPEWRQFDSAAAWGNGAVVSLRARKAGRWNGPHDLTGIAAYSGLGAPVWTAEPAPGHGFRTQALLSLRDGTVLVAGQIELGDGGMSAWLPALARLAADGRSLGWQALPGGDDLRITALVENDAGQIVLAAQRWTDPDGHASDALIAAWPLAALTQPAPAQPAPAQQAPAQ